MHPLINKKSPTDKPDSQDTKLEKQNVVSLENCLKQSPPFQKPAYSVPIFVRAHVRTQHSAASLLDTDIA